MFQIVKRLIEIARSEIGTVESPANSNRQKYGVAYGWNGVAWCVIFIWWLFHQLGLDHLLPKKTASCSILIDAAKRAGLWLTVKDGLCVGDVVFYRFGNQNHVGYVVSVSSDGKTVTSIEGNTGTGNDANGGRVMLRVRKISYVVGALRPKYETVEQPKHMALVAQECADGKGGWGSGAERKAKLTAAGYDAAECNDTLIIVQS
ncbi:MAG: CHAP domain-containing protein [Oscillibacter sp.]|nr:CHAP domain-containing protein [Oscillibacter sp.]